MPNWCENRLEIIGKKNQLKKIITIIQKDNKNKKVKSLNLASFIPIPKKAPKGYDVISKNLEKLDDSYPNWYRQNWYDYNVDFYGTKWIRNINLFLVSDIEPYNEQKNIYHLHLAFETAWNPLNKTFLTRFSKKFKVLLILGFSEQNMGFIGGAIANKDYYDYLDKDIDFEFNDESDNYEKFLDWEDNTLKEIYNLLKNNIIQF